VYGEEGDKCGQDPDSGDDDQGPVARHPDVVVERVTDVDVALETDGAEVHDRRGRTHDVRGDPNVTEHCAEDPVTEDLVGDRERHDEKSDERVCYGQRNCEEITLLSEMTIGYYGDDDECIAGDGEDNKG